MSSCRLFLLLSLLLAGESASNEAGETVCPEVQHYVAEYHYDSACDREGQHIYRSNERGRTYRSLLKTGVAAVPNQKTVYCPETVEDLFSPEHQTGFATAWIVKNTSTRPISIAYVRKLANGKLVEVSAFNANISPPNYDSASIVKPGEFKSIMTYDGHIFHAREVMNDGSLGRVLVQHRMGMLPIKNKFGHVLDCDPTEADPEPFVETVAGEPLVSPETERKIPKFQPRNCNALDVGFRNEVGCPLNVYYTGMYQQNSNPIPEDAEQAVTPSSCHEKFKFHLGNDPLPPDFMWDWASQTKFESTMVGHNFLFRLAKDERIVVDSVTLAPTMVIDCPELTRQKNRVVETEPIEVLHEIGINDDMAINPFGNKFIDLAPALNVSGWMTNLTSTSAMAFEIPPSKPIKGIYSPSSF